MSASRLYPGVPEGAPLALAKLLRKAALPGVAVGYQKGVRVVVRPAKGGGFLARVEVHDGGRVEPFDDLTPRVEPTPERALAVLARVVVLRSLDRRLSGLGSAIDELSRARDEGWTLRSGIGVAMASVCPGVDLVPDQQGGAL